MAFVSSISRLVKKTHMLRCRSIASLQRTGSMPSLVDFSRASLLDLFEQPARGCFQHPASLEIFHRQRQEKYSSAEWFQGLKWFRTLKRLEPLEPLEPFD
jgi:hypothetical protein